MPLLKNGSSLRQSSGCRNRKVFHDMTNLYNDVLSNKHANHEKKPNKYLTKSKKKYGEEY